MFASGANLVVAIGILLGTQDQPNKSPSRDITVIHGSKFQKKTIKSDLENGSNANLDSNCNVDLHSTAFSISETIQLSDCEGNSALHFAYSTGAALSIMLLETELAKANKASGMELVNYRGDTPIDNAGKISIMLPIIPKKPIFTSKKVDSSINDKAMDIDNDIQVTPDTIQIEN